MSQPAGSRPTVRDTEERFSTGIGKLDDQVNGFVPGTVTALFSDPASVHRIFLGNMLNNRETYYYTLGCAESDLLWYFEHIENVSEQAVTIETIETRDRPGEALRSAITNTDYSTGANIVIDPINVVELQEQDNYWTLVNEFKEVIDDINGVGILHSVGQSDTTSEKQEWITKYAADNILKLSQSRDRESITNYLHVKRIFGNKVTSESETLVFEIVGQFDLEISSGRNITP